MAKKKKGKKKKPKFVIAEDLLDYTLDQLEQEQVQNQDQLDQLQIKRNYIQMDRDMVEKFFLNTRAERMEVERQIINKEAEAQELEKKHKMEIKYYRQKIKHMEFDQEESNREIGDQGQNAKDKEDDDYKIRKLRMTNHKKTQKRDIGTKELKMIDEIKKSKNELGELTKELQDNLNDRIHKLIKGYEQNLQKLKADLSLKRKVQIHEIEERKNQHINDLLRNHTQAFKELKAYYNDITEDNLKLIKDLKMEIDGLNQRIDINTLHLNKYLTPNHELEHQLKETEKTCQRLKKETRQFEIHIKHKKFYKTKEKLIRQKIFDMDKARNKIDIMYIAAKKEKLQLEGNINQITDEVRRQSDQQNILLSKELQEKEQEFRAKQEKLNHIVQSQNINPQLLQELNEKIKQSLEAKNTLIKNLTYSIHHATKAYNDAIRVYEAKLTEFGIPPEELGFQTLETITSMMPAGLVSS